MARVPIKAAGAGLAATVALALPLVAAWEGLRTTPYRDLVGKPTVCYGETNAPMRSYTAEECRLMLERSLVKYAGPVLQCLPPDAPLEVKAAFTSFAYNVGVANVCEKSAAAQLARAGSYRAACDAMRSWNKVKVPDAGPWPCAPQYRYVTKAGRRYCITPGLINRRAAERALCLRGLDV